jgi:hypothetical protein
VATRYLRSLQLRADCARCCGLCCVGPAFDADQGFGFDKPAHTPCANMRADFRCAIHGERRERGFLACGTFDCYGAGQRVTQQLFGGASWRSSPDLAMRMFDAYSRYRALHELMAILEVAIERASSGDAVRLREVRRLVEDLCDSGAAMAEALPLDALRRGVLSRVRAALGAGSSALATDDTLRA